jgi:hypothetical protein
MRSGRNAPPDPHGSGVTLSAAGPFRSKQTEVHMYIPGGIVLLILIIILLIWLF